MPVRQVPPPEAEFNQLSLDDDATLYELVDAAERVFTIQQRFERFHREHPEVYAQLLDLCRRWVAAGHTAWSVKGMFEVLRWEHHIAGDDQETWKLNNNYSSRYARLIIREHREFETLFELRDLHS